MACYTILQPIYSTQKSFYGKAKYEYVKKDSEFKRVRLYSYETFILEIDKEDKTITRVTQDPKHFSNTTMKHVHEFLKQFKVEDRTKQELLQLEEWGEI